MEDAAPTAARLGGAAGASSAAPTPRTPEAPAGHGRRALAGADRRPGDVVLGRYALCRILGRGGAGTVWEAEDRHLGRMVAVKCLPAEGSDRALQEGRAAARLSHPTVVGTYGLGVADGCAWLICEYVAGDTLRRTIRDDTHSDDELLQIGIALCVALRHAHAGGIVHRDVTPRNVLVPREAFVPSGGKGTSRCHPHVPPAKLADFGIARPKELCEEARAGRIVGTHSYMAPERLEGGTGDELGDLWALGVVLHEALTGEHPAGPPQLSGALVRSHGDLPSLAPRRPDLPSTVVAAIDRAVSSAPGDRGDVLDLERALRGGLAERGVAIAPALREQPTWETEALRDDAPGPRTSRRAPSLRAAVPAAAASGALIGPAALLVLVAAALLAALSALGRRVPRRAVGVCGVLALVAATSGLVVAPAAHAIVGPAAVVAGPAVAATLAWASARRGGPHDRRRTVPRSRADTA